MPESFQHPLDRSQTVYGVRVQSGDILRASDVYDSTSGKWEKVPCPGAVVSERAGAILVRKWTDLTPTEREFLDSPA